VRSTFSAVCPHRLARFRDASKSAVFQKKPPESCFPGFPLSPLPVCPEEDESDSHYPVLSRLREAELPSSRATLPPSSNLGG